MNNLSLSFFYWMVFVTLGYFIVPRRFQLSIVSVCTFIFLMIHSPLSGVWLWVSSCLVWGSAYWFPSDKRAVLGLSGILGVVFLINSYFANQTLDGLPFSISVIGVAYYTCRHIHFLVETLKGTLEKVSFFEYLEYQFFLPVIFNGPIHSYKNFRRECQRRHHAPSHIFEGLERIVYGYAKIILIGNYFLQLKLSSWALSCFEGHSFLMTTMDSIIHWLILYAVFSGYTDVALGFSKLWGIRLEENFNRPLAATNLIDFWQRWHITLSQWCKDYLYMPVLAFTRNHMLAIIVAMIGIGLWHELSVYYFLWALYQGLGIILCRFYQIKNDPLNLKALPVFLQHSITRLATFTWLISAKPLLLFFLK